MIYVKFLKHPPFDLEIKISSAFDNEICSFNKFEKEYYKNSHIDQYLFFFFAEFALLPSGCCRLLSLHPVGFQMKWIWFNLLVTLFLFSFICAAAINSGNEEEEENAEYNRWVDCNEARWLLVNRSARPLAIESSARVPSHLDKRVRWLVGSLMWIWSWAVGGDDGRGEIGRARYTPTLIPNESVRSPIPESFSNFLFWYF